MNFPPLNNFQGAASLHPLNKVGTVVTCGVENVQGRRSHFNGHTAKPFFIFVHALLTSQCQTLKLLRDSRLVEWYIYSKPQQPCLFIKTRILQLQSSYATRPHPAKPLPPAKSFTMQLKTLIVAVGLLAFPAMSAPNPDLHGLERRVTSCYPNRAACDAGCAGQCYDIGSKHDCCDSWLGLWRIEMVSVPFSKNQYDIDSGCFLTTLS